MKLVTDHLGEIDYEPLDIIAFDEGVPGFESDQKFLLIPSGDSGFPFHYLQSVQTPNLAFVVTDPFMFIDQYDFEIDKSDEEYLEIYTEEDVKNLMILAIVTIPEDIDQCTMNTMAPILVNSAIKKGKQIVLNENYAVKYPLFQNEGKE